MSLVVSLQRVYLSDEGRLCFLQTKEYFVLQILTDNQQISTYVALLGLKNCKVNKDSNKVALPWGLLRTQRGGPRCRGNKARRQGKRGRVYHRELKPRQTFPPSVLSNGADRFPNPLQTGARSSQPRCRPPPVSIRGPQSSCAGL